MAHGYKKRTSGRKSGGSSRKSSSSRALEIEEAADYSDYEDDERGGGRSSRRKSSRRSHSSADVTSRRSSSRRSSDMPEEAPVDRRSQMLRQSSSRRHHSSKDLKESKRKLKTSKSARHIHSSKDPQIQVAERVAPIVDPLTKLDMVSKLVQNMEQEDLEVVSKLLNPHGKDTGKGKKKKVADDDSSDEGTSYFTRMSSKKKYALVAFGTFALTVVIAVCVVLFGFAQGVIANNGSQSTAPVLDTIKFSPLLTGNVSIGTLPGGPSEVFYLNINNVNFSIFDEEDLVLYITRGFNDTLIETRQLKTHLRIPKIALLKMPVKLPEEFFPGEYEGVVLSDEDENTLRRIELVQASLETIDDERDAMQPSGQPTHSLSPTNRPSLSPTERPSISPTRNPTLRPSHIPSMVPSISPTTSPPSSTPTNYPTITPRPTRLYSDAPTDAPSFNPTANNRLTRLEEVLRETLGFFPNPASSSTPQAKAVKWLAEGGPGSNLYLKGPDYNLLQHFAVVTQWFSTNPDGWTSRSMVDPSKPLCNWEGVTCTTGRGIGEQQVVGLEWPNVNMKGTIATELGFLTALTALNFHGNVLQGSMPSELDNLTNLKIFDLGGNQLTGELPNVHYNQGGLEILDLVRRSGYQMSFECSFE